MKARPLYTSTALILGAFAIAPRALCTPVFEVEPLPTDGGVSSAASGIDTHRATGFELVSGSIDGGPNQPLRATVWRRSGSGFSSETLMALDPTKDAWVAGTFLTEIAGTLNWFAAGASDGNAGQTAVFWNGTDGGPTSGPTAFPTLGGSTSEALWCGFDSELPSGDLLIGGAAERPSGVEQAVIWQGPPTGPFTITTLPHYGDFPGRATAFPVSDVSGQEEGQGRVVGWAVDSVDTLAQLWTRAGGPSQWTRTELPLPAGATQSWAHAARYDDTGSRIAVVGSYRAGNRRHAAIWEKSLDPDSILVAWEITELEAANALLDADALALGGQNASFDVVVGSSSSPQGERVATLWLRGPDDSWSSHDLNALLANAGSDGLQEASDVALDPTGDLMISGDRSGADPQAHAWVASERQATGTTLPLSTGVDALEIDVSPNPFTRTVSFAFDPGANNPVLATVHDLSGRRVATLTTAAAPARRSLVWNGRDAAGTPVAPGIYFVRFHVGTHTTTKKIVRLR